MKNNTLLFLLLVVIVVGLLIYKPVLAPFGFIFFCMLMMITMMNHMGDHTRK